MSTLFIVFHDFSLGGIQKKCLDIAQFVHYRQPNTKIIICLRHRRGIFLKQTPPYVTLITPRLHSPRLDTIPFTFWLAKQFVTYRPTTILSFLDLGSIPSIIASKLIFWQKPKVVIGEDILTSKYLQNETHPFSKTFLIKLLYPQADKILVQTLVQKNDLRLLLGQNISPKIVVSPNWLPLDYPPRTNSSSRPIDILFVGRLENQKNLPEFIDIVSHFPHLKTVIVGDGPHADAIQAYAAQITNIAFINSTLKVQKYYSRSKIFLLTSHFEGFPLTLLEAISCGCIPLSRDIPEIVTFFGKNSPHIYSTPQDAIRKISKYLKTPPDTSLLQNTVQKQQSRNLKKFVNQLDL